MPVPQETVVYDVHDFKVYPLTADTGASATYGAAVDVPGIAEASMDPNFITAELKGDARIIAKKGRIDKMTVSATYGKISLAVLETVVGGDIDDDGEVSSTWTLLGDNSLLYFKAEFKIEDVEEGLGDVHVVLHKCQLTGGTLITGATDEFGQPTLELEAIPLESTDELVSVAFYADVTALSA